VASLEEIEDLAGEYCNESGLEQAAVLEQWRSQFATDGHFVLHEAAGCENCRDGYKGRLVVYELLSGTASVKHLIRTRAAAPELLADAQRNGMRTLRQGAIEKVLQGVLDLSSARAVAS
jgi:type II secretory ATPase GspE/PulE/Tfp pilus assembly ATPase PilB-like protein